MSFVQQAEKFALQAAVKALVGNVAASPNGTASPDESQIIAGLEHFAIDLVLGVPATDKIKLPQEKYTSTFSWEGKTWTFTAEVVNGFLELSAIPN